MISQTNLNEIDDEFDGNFNHNPSRDLKTASDHSYQNQSADSTQLSGDGEHRTSTGPFTFLADVEFHGVSDTTAVVENSNMRVYDNEGFIYDEEDITI